VKPVRDQAVRLGGERCRCCGQRLADEHAAAQARVFLEIIEFLRHPPERDPGLHDLIPKFSGDPTVFRRELPLDRLRRRRRRLFGPSGG
jgi:hypothetical protein